MNKLLSAKQLAAYLGRSVRYVYNMKRGGFKMPGGLARLDAALRWLEHNPPPTRFRKKWSAQ